MSIVTLSPDWVNQLLSAPTFDEQLAHLQAADLLTPDGLTLLLSTADQLLDVDPTQTEVLLSLCERVAAQAGVAAILPQAAYLRGHVYAARGEFRLGQTAIEMARAGYISLGMTIEALRTTVGLIRVLAESGQVAAALEVGEQALAQLSLQDDTHLEAEQPEHSLLAAKLYQNCGHCYEDGGRYTEALTAYASASLRYQHLGMREAAAQVNENRGVVLMLLGQVSAAFAAFEEARRIYATEQLALEEAVALLNIGEAQSLLGNFAESLQAFAQGERILAPLGDLPERYLLWRHLGDAYLALNLYSEALDTYRKAKEGLPASYVYHVGFIFWGIGVALAAQAQFTAAQEMLAQAVQHFQILNNTPILAAIMLEQAAIYNILGETIPAQTLAQDALGLVAESNWIVQKIYAYMRTADLALPDLTVAEPLLLAAQPLVNELGLPHLNYRLNQRLGHLRLLQGNEQEAQLYLEQAIDEIERLRSTLLQEQMRASFLADKIAAYQDLVLLHLNRGDVASAFNLAERAKSRALVDLLSGSVQAQLDQTADSETNLQLQKLQADLNAIYNEMLMSSAPDQVRTVDISTLKNRAVVIEQAISGLRLRSIGGGREMPRLPIHALPTQMIWPMLDVDHALVVYHMVGAEIMAFVCVNHQIQMVRHLCAADEVQFNLRRLSVHWERARVSQLMLARHMLQLQQSTQHILHILYSQLWAPVQAVLDQLAPPGEAPVRKLTVVPHAILHQTPFHALYDGQGYLLESYAISYAPSATVFALCQQRTLRQDGMALAVGVPDAHIPAVDEEVRRVTTRLQLQVPNVCALLSQEATLAKLTALTKQCQLLHVACHGLFRGDNPMFSALKLHDGWLTAADVAQFDLTGALVTLSACESGRSHVINGDEILGLTYAFLSAGAATLLVSQWLVQDQVTAELMDKWYRYFLDYQDLAGALRVAQLEIMAQYPHPYHWAPFVLVGQRAKETKL